MQKSTRLTIGMLCTPTRSIWPQRFFQPSRLPRLPKFLINLYLPPARQSEIAVELARHIGQEFEARSYRPTRNGRSRRLRSDSDTSGMLAG